MIQTFELPPDEYNEAKMAENRDELFVSGHRSGSSFVFQKADGNCVVVPMSMFQESGDGIKPDFDKPSLIDCGQAIRFGEYEATVEAVLEELGAGIGPQRAAPKSQRALRAEWQQLTIYDTRENGESVAAACANGVEAVMARQNLYKRASDEAIASAQDAARYRYIRDVLAQFHSPHMDGTGGYRFRTPSGRGRSLDEVIDALIERDYGSSGFKPTQ